MALKKATYTLPIAAIKQLENLSKRTDKTKSGIITDLIMNTETKQDKIINQSVKLESIGNTSLKEMVGAIKTGKKFDPVETRDKTYLNRNKE